MGLLTQAALHERVKELTCLYSVAKLIERTELSLEQLLQGIVETLPPAWQYPEVTVARIELDGLAFQAGDFSIGMQQQASPIRIGGRRRGVVEIAYVEPRPPLDEGPFLKEERRLIDAIARQVAVTVERRQAAEERGRLQDQLRHADRLATIGQLAAGVAHELNEPLGNILAFAQLGEKEPELPQQTREDLRKIVMASLHAREIIKKLMLFARQTPPQKTPVDLNSIIKDGLLFLESRSAKNGVVIKRHFSRKLPSITADPAQLNQVLVNLVVNAIQAMPKGGTLKITTRSTADFVMLIVEDDGIGMSEEVLAKIFIPFFTTKDVNEGTGLGLPVVHGIVTSHGGSISVQSSPGRGARFEIQLPRFVAKTQEEPTHGGKQA
jgi:two-component system, NtrC family, sensor kinase